MNMATLPLLAGLSVVELGDSTAGAAAGAMLADLGATVVKFRRGGPSSSGAGPLLGLGDRRTVSALSAVLDRGKQVHDRAGASLFEDATVLAACREAELVICDLVEEPRSPGIIGLDAYRNLLERVARRAWVTISPFGLSGPLAGYHGSEIVCAAAGGALDVVRSAQGGHPVKLAGMQALLSTGQLACLAAFKALDLAREGGRAVLMDVSAQEAVATISSRLELSVALLRSSHSGGSGRSGPPSGLYRCRDGFVHIQVLEMHQWHGVVQAMGPQDWADGRETAEIRKEKHALIEARITEWTSPQGMVECAERLQQHGVPAVPLNTAADLLHDPQMAHRRFFQAIDLAGRTRPLPSLPICVRAAPAAEELDKQPPTGKGLRGLRLLELGHVIAVPFATSLLGAMGADVVRIDELRRLDIYRRSRPLAHDTEGPERGCYYIVNNHDKRPVAVAEVASAARLQPLLAEAEVVVENWGGRAKRAGLDAASLFQARPDLLAVSCSGFGGDGPMGGYRAYAYSVHAFGGLLDASRDEHGEIVSLRSAWADFCTGVTLAILVAAWAIGPCRRQGAAIDLSMAEVVAGRLADLIAAIPTGETGTAPLANTMRGACPNNAYRTGDDATWLALSVSDDAQWNALLQVLENPASLSGTEYATQAGREAIRAEIDRRLGDCLMTQDGVALFHRLQKAGVPCAPVYDARRMMDDAHLRARDFFSPMTHPDLGNYDMPSLPWMEMGQARTRIVPAQPLAKEEVGLTDMAKIWGEKTPREGNDDNVDHRVHASMER